MNFKSPFGIPDWSEEWREVVGARPCWVTYTWDNTAAPQQDTKTYSEGFDDGWNARGVADGKPQEP